MRIILATDNSHKLEELSAVLPDSLNLVPQGELGISTPEETGLTFVENAIIKARHASRISGLPAIADDSGLEVKYLKGAPGIYSSRYAGEHASDAENNSKLLVALNGVQGDARSATFQCIIVFLQHYNDPTPIIASGSWNGRILQQAKGTSGFGYDPIFQPLGLETTAAELSSTEKNQLSHRAKALDVLRGMIV